MFRGSTSGSGSAFLNESDWVVFDGGNGIELTGGLTSFGVFCHSTLSGLTLFILFIF
jgi:hypothetical protein